VDLKAVVAEELDAARRRTLDLLAPLGDDDLRRQHSPIMSPLVWDLAHVGNYEDLWLVRALGGEPVRPDVDDLYDAFRHPRPNRPMLPLLGPAEARTYLATVRQRALDRLDAVDLHDNGNDPLRRDAFVHGMVIQHEHQHDETILATLQLMEGDGYRDAATTAPTPPPAPTGPTAPPPGDEVLVPGGSFVMGTDAHTEPWALDNERPAHEVDLPSFFIDTTPVTNRAYLEFVEAGGYDDPGWWTTEGWKWRQAARLEHPEFWRREDRSWWRTRLGIQEEVPPTEPVQHVGWYEADAYARWRGQRLPTEAEWEKAAAWDPATESKRRYPWGDEPPVAGDGRANLAPRHLGPAPVGVYPAGVSAYGCHQLVGDVWEWTSSDFLPWPGFAPHPYREYSEVFFAHGYMVLRGGSWATRRRVARATFRNWDHPQRRQIFAGFRCAA
jgi:iron(II)-dependent oxidoreductase